jgi:hypothetical protein
MDQMEQRMEMLDRRLDNIDTVVTALVERIMKQPITIEITCPSCGSPVEMTLTGNVKVGVKGSRNSAKA